MSSELRAETQRILECDALIQRTTQSVVAASQFMERVLENAEESQALSRTWLKLWAHALEQPESGQKRQLQALESSLVVEDTHPKKQLRSRLLR